MSKIAKITLTADNKEFRKKMDETKKLLNDMGEMKVNPTISDDFKKKFEQDLVKSAEALEDKIGDIEVALNKAGKRGMSAYDSKDVQELVKRQEEYNQKLKDTKRALEEIKNTGSNGGAPQGGDVRNPEQEKQRQPGMIKKAGGMIGSNMGRAASGMGFSMGVGALVGRARSLAQQDVGIRQLTGGKSIGDERSELGFTRAERNTRAKGLAQAAGKDMDSEELTKQVNFGEKIERAFGIGAGEQAQTMSAARKSGVKDEQKFMGDSISTALQAGLEGSSIGEYLASMTGYMESMSKGIDVNEGSLRGFSGALASMDFFKQDPSRIFDTINSLSQMFSGGDRFQQAQSALAINQVAGGGASPSGIEVRRKMGLFGKLDDNLLESAGFSDQQRKTLGTDGGDILKQTFGNVMKQTEGLDKSAQFEAFLNATNLDPGAGLPIFDKLVNGKDVGEMDMKALEDANKTPEELMAERIKGTMDNHSGEMMEATAIISHAMDELATELGVTVSTLVTKLDELGISFSTVAKVMMAGMAMNAMGAFKGGGGGMAGGLGGLAGGMKGKMGGMMGLLKKLGPLAGKGALVGAAGYGGYKLGEAAMNTDAGNWVSDKGSDGMKWVSDAIGFTDSDEDSIAKGEAQGKANYEKAKKAREVNKLNNKMKTVKTDKAGEKTPTFSEDKKESADDISRGDSTTQIVNAISSLKGNGRTSPKDVRAGQPSGTRRQK